MRNVTRQLTVDFTVEGDREQREVYFYEEVDTIPTQEEYLQDVKNFVESDNVLITGFHVEEV